MKSGDGKIHIPARKKIPARGQQVVRLNEEAYNILVELFNESTLSMKELVSTIIIQSKNNIVFDKED